MVKKIALIIQSDQIKNLISARKTNDNNFKT